MCVPLSGQCFTPAHFTSLISLIDFTSPWSSSTPHTLSLPDLYYNKLICFGKVFFLQICFFCWFAHLCFCFEIKQSWNKRKVIYVCFAFNRQQILCTWGTCQQKHLKYKSVRWEKYATFGDPHHVPAPEQILMLRSQTLLLLVLVVVCWMCVWGITVLGTFIKLLGGTQRSDRQICYSAIDIADAANNQTGHLFKTCKCLCSSGELWHLWPHSYLFHNTTGNEMGIMLI